MVWVRNIRIYKKLGVSFYEDPDYCLATSLCTRLKQGVRIQIDPNSIHIDPAQPTRPLAVTLVIRLCSSLLSSRLAISNMFKFNYKFRVDAFVIEARIDVIYVFIEV